MVWFFFHLYLHYDSLLTPVPSLFLFFCLFHLCLINPPSPHYIPYLEEQSFTCTLNSIFQTPSPKATNLSALPEGQQQWQWGPVFSPAPYFINTWLETHLSSGCFCAWLYLSQFTWVLPGGLWWLVCLLTFSFLQAEANSVSYDASCMFVSISLVN